MRLTLLTILGLAVLLVAACSTTALERAEAEKWRAKAGAEAAPITAQVAVIEAEKNAALEQLRALTDINKEMRSFDAQMGRNEFATIVLEFEALNLAIRQETEAANEAATRLNKAAENAEPIGHNALAAARNTFFANWLLGIIGALLLGLTATLIFFCAKFERRLAALEK